MVRTSWIVHGEHNGKTWEKRGETGARAKPSSPCRPSLPSLFYLVSLSPVLYCLNAWNRLSLWGWNQMDNENFWEKGRAKGLDPGRNLPFPGDTAGKGGSYSPKPLVGSPLRGIKVSWNCPLLIFRPNWGLKGRKKPFWDRPPPPHPLSQGLEDRALPLPMLSEDLGPPL